MTFATSDERYFASLVNATRRKEGLEALRMERNLNEAAEAHSKWMLATDIFSHTGRGGSSSSDRIRDAGFAMEGESWSTAENIAYVRANYNGTFRDEIQQLHQNLLNSPNHYANIVDERSSLIGIGLELGNFDGHRVLIVTQNFGDTTGRPDIDTGRFPVTNMPETDLSVQGRAAWARGFDGEVVTTGPDPVRVQGTINSDDFRLGTGSDFASGRLGEDWMAGGQGNDTLHGDHGNDRLLGGFGHDWMVGGAGNDTLEGNPGQDQMRGEAGADLLFGGTGNDRMSGGDHDDRLVGRENDDLLVGNNGNDWLQGDAGKDSLQGGAGQDTLIGGDHADVMNGGTKADSFVFMQGDGRDTIQGYQEDVDRLMIDRDLVDQMPGAFVRDHIREAKNGVIIDFGDGDVLVVKARGLTAEDAADDLLLI